MKFKLTCEETGEEFLLSRQNVNTLRTLIRIEQPSVPNDHWADLKFQQLDYLLEMAKLYPEQSLLFREKAKSFIEGFQWLSDLVAKQLLERFYAALTPEMLTPVEREIHRLSEMED